MPRPSITGASLLVVAIMAAAGCLGKHRPDVPGEKTRMATEITPEQARAALLRLHSLRVLTGGEDDPILLDLKSGAIAQTDGSSVTIGRFCSCNLKEKTWQMAFSNGRAGRAHFSWGANGRFELQSDGTWLAIETGGYIT
jgi:hypothetical protein